MFFDNLIKDEPAQSGRLLVGNSSVAVWVDPSPAAGQNSCERQSHLCDHRKRWKRDCNSRSASFDRSSYPL